MYVHVYVLYMQLWQFAKQTVSLQDTCDIEAKTITLRTALHGACREGLTRCVEQLVGYGANVTVADLLQNTPLHYLLGKKNAQPLSDWTPHLNEVNYMYMYVFMQYQRHISFTM